MRHGTTYIKSTSKDIKYMVLNLCTESNTLNAKEYTSKFLAQNKS